MRPPRGIRARLRPVLLDSRITSVSSFCLPSIVINRINLVLLYPSSVQNAIRPTSLLVMSLIADKGVDGVLKKAGHGQDATKTEKISDGVRMFKKVRPDQPRFFLSDFRNESSPLNQPHP